MYVLYDDDMYVVARAHLRCIDGIRVHIHMQICSRLAPRAYMMYVSYDDDM